MPAAALVMAPTPPRLPEDDEPVDVLPVLPVLEVMGAVSPPFGLVVDGVTIAPVELTNIGGLSPVEKPANLFAALTGPVKPILLNENIPWAADALGSCRPVPAKITAKIKVILNFGIPKRESFERWGTLNMAPLTGTRG